MFSFDDIVKRWDNFSEVEKTEILAYASALKEDNTSVPGAMTEFLEQRLEKYQNSQQEHDWNQLYNKLINELI